MRVYVIHRTTVVPAEECRIAVVRDDQRARFEALVDAGDIDGALLSASVTSTLLDEEQREVLEATP